MKRGDPDWYEIPKLNHVPYEQQILLELRKRPITKADFPHIKRLHEKIAAIKHSIPEGYSIEGEYIWTKGKFGIRHREFQYRLKTTLSTALLSDTCLET